MTKILKMQADKGSIDLSRMGREMLNLFKSTSSEIDVLDLWNISLTYIFWFQLL